MNVCPKCGSADLDVTGVDADTVHLKCCDPNCLTRTTAPIPDSVAPTVRALGARLAAHQRAQTNARLDRDLPPGEVMRLRALARGAVEQTRAEIRELIAA